MLAEIKAISWPWRVDWPVDQTGPPRRHLRLRRALPHDPLGHVGFDSQLAARASIAQAEPLAADPGETARPDSPSQRSESAVSFAALMDLVPPGIVPTCAIARFKA